MMEFKDWLLIVGPLVGVVIGGAITSVGKWLELRHQRLTERRNRKLKHREELHELLGRCYHSSQTFGSEIMGLCATNVSESDRRKGLISAIQSFDGPIIALASKLQLYVPSVESKTADMLQKQTDATSSGAAFAHLHLQNSVSPMERDKMYKDLHARLLHLSAIVGEIQLVVQNEFVQLLEE